MDNYLINIIIIGLLVLANAVFVAVEFALVRSHPTKLRGSELEGKYGVESSLKLMENLDESLSATQLGITLMSLTLGWIGEATFASLFMQSFKYFNTVDSAILSHGLATALALAIVTFVHVVIGELCAKSVAIRYPESVLRFLAPTTLIFTQSCRFFIRFFNATAGLILKIFGLSNAPEGERVHSPDELSMLIAHSSERGILDKTEEAMLKGIFGFSETVAREIMTPRTDLATIPVTSSFDEILALITKSGFSRFPVTGEKVDDVAGILMSRDLIPIMQRYRKGEVVKFDLRNHLREAYFIPGTKPIDHLLNEFKQRKVHMAIVLDEHGGVDGAVTLEDIIEEIVGDIFDESDSAENDVVVSDDGDILVDGGLLVADVNEKFDLDIPEGDYDTVGGFIFSALGRMSQTGDQIHLQKNKIVAVNGAPINGISSNGNGKDHADHTDHDAEYKEEHEQHKEGSEETILTVERLSGNRIETVRVHVARHDDKISLDPVGE